MLYVNLTMLTYKDGHFMTAVNLIQIQTERAKASNKV